MGLSIQHAGYFEDHDSHDARQFIMQCYKSVRRKSHEICAPLAIEDYVIQTMPDVSPPKWHLAHTSWFFETFLLIPFLRSYRVFDAKYGYLFNSYYETIGNFHPRKCRGLLSRPTTQAIYQYRAYVDEHIEKLIASVPDEHWGTCYDRLMLGIHHEQQHQELMYTDIKHIFAINPLRPVYQTLVERSADHLSRNDWLPYDGGVVNIGHEGRDFAYDNESPRHHVYLENFYCASHPVTNGEYREFIDAGGYQNPEYWLSDGWKSVKENQWIAPLYWEKMENEWWLMTLSGMRCVDEDEPVCHVSYYEADAYARWSGKRLLTEAEWEHVANDITIHGNFSESGHLHPIAVQMGKAPYQVFGDVWEWTQSPYIPYPGYCAPKGAIGEYNGKFMCNQMVLRGGSCATSSTHMRATYRNFFFPADRWQFTGIRLGEDR